MKKFIFVFALAFVMLSCGNSKSTQSTNDSTTVDTTVVDSVQVDSVK